MVLPFLEGEHLSTNSSTTPEPPKPNTILAANALVTTEPKPQPATPIAAIALSAGGGAVVVGGAVAVVVGVLPFFAFQGQNEQLKGLRADFGNAESAADQAAISDEAAALQRETDQSLTGWNDSGQYLFVGGVVAVGLGVAAAGVGNPWLLMGE
jgi:hypothetical protein